MANNATENIQLNLKINGVDAFNTLKDLNAHVAAARNSLNKMDVKDPGYAEAAKKLRQATEAQKAWRNEIYSTQKTSKSFFDDFKTNLASIAGGVTIGTLIANGISSAVGSMRQFIGESEAAFKEAEQNQAQLAAAIHSTGGAAGRTQEQLNNLSSELMSQTGIDDDLISKSEALLLTFTNISGEIYDQTLPLILDISKALGQDLQTSSIQVGKALNDPIHGLTALKRVGVSFSEEQKALIKRLQETGDIAGAQKVILAELAKEFGGVAKALSNTESGQLERFDTRIKNIQENIGGMMTRMKLAREQSLEPFVRLLEKLTTVPVSEKLHDEQMSLAGMRIELDSNNTSSKRRLDIINELKKQYPAYLDKIDAEKAKNADLLPILDKINEAFVLRIAYQKRAEKMDDAIKKEADLMNEKYSNQQNLIMKIAEIQEKIGEDGIKFTIKGKNENEKALYIYHHLTDAISEQAKKSKELNAIVASNKYDYLIAGLTSYSNELAESTRKLKEQQEVRRSIVTDLEKFKNSQGLKDGPTDIHHNPHAPKPAKKVNGDTDDDNDDENDEKKAKKKAISEAQKALNEFGEFGEEYKKLRADQLLDSLEKNEKEVQQEKNKYQGLINEREKYLKKTNLTKEERSGVESQIKGLKADESASVTAIRSRQKEDLLKEMADLHTQLGNIHQNESEKEIALINKKYSRWKDEAKGSAEMIKMLEANQATELADVKIREEKRFQDEKKAIQSSLLADGLSKDEQEKAALNKKYDDEIEALKQKHTKEFQETKEFHDLLDEIESNRKKALVHQGDNEGQKEAKKSIEFACNVAQQTSDAVFSIMSANRQAEIGERIASLNKQREAELANKNLTESQKKAINDRYDKQVADEKLKVWQADKASAITQAVINGAIAVTKFLAMGQPWMAAAAAATTAAQIVVIASQKPPKFEQGGILPRGSSHANGGISLIDTSGKKVGEIEGGEPILSRETYANNRQLIDALLYSSQRLNGASIGINTHEVIKADRMFHYGGLAPTHTTITNHTTNNQVTDLSVLLHKFDELKAAVQEEKMRPVSFNYRVFEDYRDKIDGVRAWVEA